MKKFTLVTLLAIAVMFTSGRTMAQSSGVTSISTSFTTADIPAGRQIWFASSVQVAGAVTYPLHIYFHHQTISCAAFNIAVPDGELILDPSYTHATSSFNGTKWVTTSPPNEPGYYLMAAAQYSRSSVVPGGQNPVTWYGTFTASRPGVLVNWKWWCASYWGFNGPIYSDGAKASDCPSCTQWAGAAHAGTPEYVNHEHDLSGLNEFTGGGTGYSYTDSASVICSEADEPAVAVVASATSICTGDSIVFTASASNGGSAPSYQWKKNGVNVGTNSPTYMLHSAVDGDQIFVVLTSSDPLASPSTVFSNSVTVTVNSAPAPATISGGSTLCAGGTLMLSASAIGGVWSSGNTAISTVSSSGAVGGIAAGTGTISYTISNSCGVAVATKTVTVSSGFALSGTLISPTCNGYTNGSVVASPEPIDGHSYTYAWDNGSTSFGLWGVAAGTYSLTATNETGCSVTEAFTITEPAPMASTYSVTDDYGYGGDNGAVYYGVSGGTWPYTYSWSNGATTQNITGLTGGDYVVTTTDANSCTLTNWFSVGGPRSGGARTASSSTGTNTSVGVICAASPNPFSSETTISFAASDNGNTTVDVYSAVTGERVTTIFNEDTHAGQEYSCRLAGDKLAPGVYVYKIASGDKNLYTGRIVLVK